MFTSDWLALRSSADDAARNKTVLERVTGAFARRKGLRVIDLASGTGANIRALAPHLGEAQFWAAVDHSPDLLSHARRAFRLWADSFAAEHDSLVLQKSRRHLSVKLTQADLTSDVGPVLDKGFDLVTMAAFLDLVSVDWISSFAIALAERNLPLYATLNYSGEESWEPPHAADALILSAFTSHQRSNKGFGPAAGPTAAREMARKLKEAGYSVVMGESPWRIGQEQSRLMSAVLDGIASAASETALVPLEEINIWRKAREASTRCVIGHIDIFAVPPPH